MQKRRIAIFASGEGTNAQCIMDHFRNSAVGEVAWVVSSKSSAPVLERAKKAGIESRVLDRVHFYETDTIIKELKERKIDLIVLAGFLWMVPEYLIKAFPNAIINIHPALLPKFGGKGMYGMKVHEAVIASKEKESGISIHYVNEHYDEGKIISQFKCSVAENDTPELLAKKIHQLEHMHFANVIETIFKK